MWTYNGYYSSISPKWSTLLNFHHIPSTVASSFLASFSLFLWHTFTYSVFALIYSKPYAIPPFLPSHNFLPLSLQLRLPLSFLPAHLFTYVSGSCPLSLLLSFLVLFTSAPQSLLHILLTHPFLPSQCFFCIILYTALGFSSSCAHTYALAWLKSFLVFSFPCTLPNTLISYCSPSFFSWFPLFFTV